MLFSSSFRISISDNKRFWISSKFICDLLFWHKRFLTLLVWYPKILSDAKIVWLIGILSTKCDPLIVNLLPSMKAGIWKVASKGPKQLFIAVGSKKLCPRSVESPLLIKIISSS